MKEEGTSIKSNSLTAATQTQVLPTAAPFPVKSARERAEERRKRDGIFETQHTLSDYEDDREVLGCLLSPEEVCIVFCRIYAHTHTLERFF